jgi:hypothetical protein
MILRPPGSGADGNGAQAGSRTWENARGTLGAVSRRPVSFKLPPDLIAAARAKSDAEAIAVTAVVEEALVAWVGADGLEAVRRWRRSPEEQRLLDELSATGSRR